MKKLKVLNADMTSPFQNFKYERGKEYVCEDFDSDPNKDCAPGFYATDVEGLIYSFRPGKEVWEVEVGGKSVIYDRFKQRFEKQTIVRKLTEKEIRELARNAKVGYNLEEVIFPINPFLINNQITEKHIELLKVWASVPALDLVWHSIRVSIWHSVRNSDSVLDSVWKSVWESGWNSVIDLVWNSLVASDSISDSIWDLVSNSNSDRDLVYKSLVASGWAYISSLFPNIETWKFISHEPGVNPFQSGNDLWRDGFVPSFDGKTWRLHSGDKGEIVFAISKEKLK